MACQLDLLNLEGATLDALAELGVHHIKMPTTAREGYGAIRVAAAKN